MSRVRVLVVDDSALNRRGIRRVLESDDRIEVVGESADGNEALRAVSERKPDAITLDLEMPRMDGFTLLRILMARRPLPVIVVSSYSQKENIFHALELGAIDFVEKPERGFFSEEAGKQFIEKVMLARNLRPPRLALRSASTYSSSFKASQGYSPSSAEPTKPTFLIGIAASTGGPAALLDIFARLPEHLPAAIVVAQHMPERFTQAFAARLDRQSAVFVREASDGEKLLAKNAYVCPGGSCMEVEQVGRDQKIRLCKPSQKDAYVPSADRLFKSVASVAGSRSIGVVLTGMGSDGVEGARGIRDARGLVIVESRDTAVVDGMPTAVIRAGLAGRVLPLSAIGELLATLSC
ncbi:MAG: chemotaxis response regulator protein-glutamate methylesterase [Sorangium cellulosum]|nr:MAG: chemotaxis response regulator protein-glutamate methylesterase [Sorangium cellulosum]